MPNASPENYNSCTCKKGIPNGESTQKTSGVVFESVEEVINFVIHINIFVLVF